MSYSLPQIENICNFIIIIFALGFCRYLSDSKMAVQIMFQIKEILFWVCQERFVFYHEWVDLGWGPSMRMLLCLYSVNVVDCIDFQMLNVTSVMYKKLYCILILFLTCHLGRLFKASDWMWLLPIEWARWLPLFWPVIFDLEAQNLSIIKLKI